MERSTIITRVAKGTHTDLLHRQGRLGCVYSASLAVWERTGTAVVGRFTGVTMDLVDGRDGSGWLVGWLMRMQVLEGATNAHHCIHYCIQEAAAAVYSGGQQ